jgi:hypothetical protein
MKPDRQPQKFFRDLYKDLDDRHLVLPVIALVVAIIAVPLLLGGGEEPVTAPPVAQVDPGATAVESAVLVEASGIRNYRKRLDQLKATNPFKQQFATTAKASSEDAAATDSSAASSDPGLLPGDITVGGEPLVPPAPGGNSGGTGDTTTDTVTETVTETKEITRLVTRRIDVNVGPQGDLKRVDGVKDLTLLPSKQTPVVAFLGVSENGKQATFAVSADVASTSGGGRCIGGGPIACEFLTLEVGQQQSFEYTPNGQNYRLKLLGISDVELKVPGKSGK